MTPKSQIDLTNNFTITQSPSKTYKINDVNDTERIYGTIDGIEAIKQAIYLILNTERYEHIIYSWNYGIELANLFGKDKYYVMAVLEQVISEALLQDDRITDVIDFEFESEKNKIYCTFTVITIYGNINAEKTIEV